MSDLPLEAEEAMLNECRRTGRFTPDDWQLLTAGHKVRLSGWLKANGVDVNTVKEITYAMGVHSALCVKRKSGVPQIRWENGERVVDTYLVPLRAPMFPFIAPIDNDTRTTNDG